jgi:hypothetical protein
MSASNTEDVSPISCAASYESGRPAWSRVFIVTSSLIFVLILIASTLLLFTPERRLTEKEQQLVGTWKMQKVVVSFNERGDMTVGGPPFTTSSSGWWYIDENDHLHCRSKDVMETIFNFNHGPLDCDVRTSNGNVILTTKDGADHVLIPYVGPELQVLNIVR